MLINNSTLINQTEAENQFVSAQFSYSTADIEKSIFHTPEYSPPNFGEPLMATKMIVIHGNFITLEEDSIPQPSSPLTEESGLFKIIKLVEESES